MKRLHNLIVILLCVLLFAVPLHAFAENTDDLIEETETEQTTTQPATTAPKTTVFEVPTNPPETSTSSPIVTQEPAPFVPPLVKITRKDLTKKPGPGESFTMIVVFHNYSKDTSLQTGIVSFEPSEGLILEENSASIVVPAIAPDDVRSIQLKARVSKDAQAANQSIATVYTYSYKTPDGLLQQAEYTDKLLLTVTPVSSSDTSSTAASATPNIIVTGYDYGGTIAAGDTFTMRLQFRNTSAKLSAENIVMSVETGTGLSITSASNTYYYSSLGPGQSKSQSIPMLVAANAEPEGAKIDISFRYEYVDGGNRSNTTASERLSVPIYIPDRFTVSAPDMDLIGTQNEELSVSLPYVNKSRVGVSNVSAQLLFDEEAVFCEQPRINLGNFDPGKSGTIDFYFTPLEAGDGSVTVQITYEDELMQEKKLDIRVPYSAEEGYFDTDMEEMTDIPEEESSGISWVYIAIAAGAAVVLVVIIVLVVRKRKKKKASEPSIDFDWNPPQEVNAHEDP